MLRIIIFIILTSAALQASAAGNFPLDLYAVAHAHDCEEIPEFMGRPGRVDPPYAYGYLKGKKEGSAVFWCRSKTDSNLFKLVIYVNNRDSKFKCKDEVETRNYPGGISLLKDQSISLAEFTYLGEKKKGPNIVGNKDNFIMSYYDGVESIFYCYDGKWLSLFRH